MAVTRLREGRIPLLVASGGDDEYDIVGDDGILYRVHRFLTSDDFVVTKGRAPVAMLLLGGGGSGSGGTSRGGRPGPAGGVVEVGAVATVGTHAVAVGSGGAATSRGGTNNGNAGGSSSAFGITASGGGSSAGGNIVYTTSAQGAPGGITDSRTVYSDNVREFGAQGIHGGLEAGGAATGWTATSSVWYSDIEGTRTAYALTGETAARGAGIRDAVPVPDGYGHGGRPADPDDNVTNAGGRGGDGVVIIRYPLRRA